MYQVDLVKAMYESYHTQKTTKSNSSVAALLDLSSALYVNVKCCAGYRRWTFPLRTDASRATISGHEVRLPYHGAVCELVST